MHFIKRLKSHQERDPKYKKLAPQSGTRSSNPHFKICRKKKLWATPSNLIPFISLVNLLLFFFLSVFHLVERKGTQESMLGPITKHF